MRIITYFTGTDDPAANRRAVLCLLLVLNIIIGIILFAVSPRVNAAESSAGTQNAQDSDSGVMHALRSNEQLSADLEAACKALDEAQLECDALRSALEDSDAVNAQLRMELEELKAANAVSYVLRFRIERNVTFPENSEILYFTRTVDQETYNRWQTGSIIQEKTDFLTIPNSGMFHEWVIILDGKYTANKEGCVTSPSSQHPVMLQAHQKAAALQPAAFFDYSVFAQRELRQRSSCAIIV